MSISQNDIHVDTDTYMDILNSELTESWIGLCITFILSIVAIILLVIWKNVQCEERSSKRQKVKASKHESIKWWAIVIAFSLIIVMAAISQISAIHDFLYDINNEAFVIYDKTVMVETKTVWNWRGPSVTEYYIIFGNDVETTRIRLSEREAQKYNLFEGEYNDIILIYGLRSQELLAIMYR